MKRHVTVAALVLLVVVPLLAQAPKGWRLRVDRSTSASDPDAEGAIKFVTMGAGVALPLSANGSRGASCGTPFAPMMTM